MWLWFAWRLRDKGAVGFIHHLEWIAREILETAVTEYLRCGTVKDFCGRGGGREGLEGHPERLGLGELFRSGLYLPQYGIELCVCVWGGEGGEGGRGEGGGGGGGEGGRGVNNSSYCHS